MDDKHTKHAGRKPTDSITAEHLKEFIATQDDFALELFAYSLARDFGFSATHAGSYVDPISGKARQFDVQATRSCDENFHIYLAIECKSLRPSFPLLVSQLPRIYSESYQQVLWTSGKGQQSFINIGHSVATLADGASLYRKNQFVGKAISQVGFNGEGKLHSKDSEVFEKWGQAIASSSQLLNKAAALNKSLDKQLQKVVVVPILVVPDGTLWVVKYNEYGACVQEPENADEAEYFIEHVHAVKSETEGPYTITHLHFVTKTGLRNLLSRFAKDGDDAIHLMNMNY
jgi:hypothetical protein